MHRYELLPEWVALQELLKGRPVAVCGVGAQTRTQRVDKCAVVSVVSMLHCDAGGPYLTTKDANLERFRRRKMLATSPASA